MDKKKSKFIELVDSFIQKYENDNVIDEKIKLKILKEATAWNKETVLSEMIKRVDEHRLYEEEGFPFMYFVNLFLSGSMPITINPIKEEDMS